jgi:membrane-associated phospholipid phosphatase
MLNDHLTAAHWPHTAAVACTRAEPMLVAALLGWAWWTARRQSAAVMAAALWAPIGVVAAVAVNEPIEQMPTVRWTAFHGLVVRSSDLPAPSDHAAVAAAAAAGLFLVGRRFGVAACGAWLVMALALTVGGAVPDDIAGGTVVGVTVTLIGFVLFEGPLRRAVARLRRTRLRSFTGDGEASSPQQ